MKIGPKTVDCIFIGYSLHSTTYRFLVINYEVNDISNNTTMESRDAIFFEDVFPLKKIRFLNQPPRMLIILTYLVIVMQLMSLTLNVEGVKDLERS